MTRYKLLGERSSEYPLIQDWLAEVELEMRLISPEEGDEIDRMVKDKLIKLEYHTAG